MRVFRLLAAAVVLCTASLGAGSQAVGLGFKDFDRLKDYQQENFILTALHFYYYGYKNNPNTIYKANCMLGLNDNVVEGGDSYLLLLINKDINSARVIAEKPKSRSGLSCGIKYFLCTPQSFARTRKTSVHPPLNISVGKLPNNFRSWPQ
jgi:hypothetical protein